MGSWMLKKKLPVMYILGALGMFKYRLHIR